ncbi:hypothetical protein BUALT_Bualt17G0056200 [Buddleja alternifolia]|uniref:Uncharacterized protein n=1 Tax=Buddleja alternifolia TaxID=168488 RepID=A0AAV6W7Y1_9LAMI|nr:hypothetical protein BUALT_Bualt17G0056200 [Buddleja alternifolia]
MDSNSSKFSKAIFRVIVLVGIVGLLIVGAVGDHENIGGRKMMKTSIGGAAGNYMKQYDDIRAVSKFQLNYISKRRVPNGSDPIHNRRAGSSTHPPGQA